MAEWLNKYPQDNLEKTMNFLVECLPMPEFSNAAAAALQVCFSSFISSCSTSKTFFFEMQQYRI